MKIVINRCFGGFSLSDKACKWISDKIGKNIDKNYYYWNDEDRIDPILIECVETLGTSEASGIHAELHIVEIPDDVDWRISNYDGMETVEEKHGTWC